MNGFRIDEAGIVWQPCPACGQDVVPSHNGWKRHVPYCPALTSARADFERSLASIRATMDVSPADAQALAAKLRERAG